VIDVSWHDAKEYVAWLSRKTAKAYRLSSEAEWEYAARAGTTTKYAFGDVITVFSAQYSLGPRGSGTKTVEVGSLVSNKFGLHHMHGNVSEWCEDDFHFSYDGAPLDGSAWRGGHLPYRILRGGSWTDLHFDLRSASRNGAPPDYRSPSAGFRVARALD
jgi:formylglycine-generating enzyme required for sulfatase activity